MLPHSRIDIKPAKLKTDINKNVSLVKFVSTASIRRISPFVTAVNGTDLVEIIPQRELLEIPGGC